MFLRQKDVWGLRRLNFDSETQLKFATIVRGSRAAQTEQHGVLSGKKIEQKQQNMQNKRLQGINILQETPLLRSAFIIHFCIKILVIGCFIIR